MKEITKELRKLEEEYYQCYVTGATLGSLQGKEFYRGKTLAIREAIEIICKHKED